jgi:hypothetical protein
MSEELSREEVHQTVDRAVADLLDEAGIQEPPIDVLVLARTHLGMNWEEEPLPTRRGRRKVAANGPMASEEDRQWIVAQAIAERRKPDLLRRLGLAPEGPRPLTGESLGNLFAERLLVPTRWLASVGRACGFDLLALKERFCTASHERIAWRMLDLSEPCVITVIDQGAVSKRRGNAFRVNRDLVAAERICQEQVHRYSRPYLHSAGGWTVHGWPVHFPDWKREILRAVVEEEAREAWE